MMHHCNHCRAFRLCTGKLLLCPCHCFFQDSSRKCIRVRVKAENAEIICQRDDPAEGMFIACVCRIIAKPAHLSEKGVPCHPLCRGSDISGQYGRIPAVDIMIAGNHKHPDSFRLKTRKHPSHFQKAFQFAVQCKITRKQYRIRMFTKRT